MNKLSKMKIVLVIAISLSVIVAFTNWVYAVEDDPFLSAGNNASSGDNLEDDDDFVEAAPVQNNNSNANNTNVDNTNKANDLLTNNTNNQNNNKNTNNNVNRNVSNTETLAKTGLTDSNGFVAFIVVLCSVSAIYSFKKIRDYKKI